jgi:DNA repair ATPase RecN
VRYYKTADVRSSLNSALHQIDKAQRQTRANVQKMRKICRPLIPTHPRLRFLLKRTDATLRTLRGYRGDVLRLRGELERLARGRARIREDQPEWQQLQRLRQRYEAIGKQAEETVNQFKQHAEQLQTAVREAHGG